jgi:signal transduction histidine kinase
MSTLAATATSGRPAVRQVITLGLIALAVVLIAAGIALHLPAGDPGRPDAGSLTRAGVVLLWAVAGAYTWWRRPADRFGLYLFGTAVLFALATLSLSSDEVAHTFGRVILAAFLVCLTYVLLCIPHDHLATKSERRVLTTFTLTSALLWAVVLPLADVLPVAGPLTACNGECPGNAFQLVDTSTRVSDALTLTTTIVSAAFVLLAAIALYRKARSPMRIRQRLIVPILGAASGLALNYALFTVLRELDVGRTGIFSVIGGAIALAIPLTIVLGQARGRASATTSLARLIPDVGTGKVTPPRVQALLRTALGDRELTLALRDPSTGGYVDVNGDKIVLPSEERDVSITWVMREDVPVAALMHDAAVTESGVTRGLAAAALMLLENTQLAEELQASRARIVASAHRERLRLERNLHDGAQQRLLGIQIKLEAAREHTGDGELAHELEEVAGDAAAAVEDLRELAHGLYPTVLRERGLRDGLSVIARQTTAPVRIRVHEVSRCLPTVEEAVYFCALEAIQNATKHGGDGARITVTLERRGDDLHFAIADDGSGFDPHESVRGMGITNMRDRIGAVGGTLEIVSQRGRGTTVVGVVPGGCPEG